MKHSRLEGLADGIFAIVMTLLVFELDIPHIAGVVTNGALLEGLRGEVTSLLSYTLSFLFLFTYWRGHHYIVSIFAKNLDNQLTNINAFFLLFVALIPFTTSILGTYSHSQVAIAVYGIHIVIIGLLLFWMRAYIRRSKTIENEPWTPHDRRNGTIRILMPVAAAALAIPVGFWSPQVSLSLFTFAVLFNLSTASTRIVNWFMSTVFGRPLPPMNPGEM